jgi:hypothetical protein
LIGAWVVELELRDLYDLKVVVYSEKTLPQGTTHMGDRFTVISLVWTAAPGLFLCKPFGQSCFWLRPASGARPKVLRAAFPAPALTSKQSQFFRHASGRYRLPPGQSVPQNGSECIAGIVVVVFDPDLPVMPGENDISPHPGKSQIAGSE